MKTTYGYFKLTRAGLNSGWWKRSQEALSSWKQRQVWGTRKSGIKDSTPTARMTFDLLCFNPDGIIWTTKRTADQVLRWARTLPGWKEKFLHFGDQSGEPRI